MTPASPPTQTSAIHLMCGSRTWTIAAFLCSVYFAKVAIARVSVGGAQWSHDPFHIVTHMVWVAFLVGLFIEAHCAKERIFFGLLLINFVVAVAMGLWNGAPLALVQQTRLLSAGTWGLSVLVSAVLIFSRGDATGGTVPASEAE